MNPLPIQNEQEAAVAILFACLLGENNSLDPARVEHLSHMLVHSSKFVGYSLQDLVVKVVPWFSTTSNKVVIEQSSSFISEGFRETLFAMICEIMTREGALDESESEVVGLAALYLGLSIELMRGMLSTFLIRNRWNVKVVPS
jgi:hypothetical protein